MASGANTLDNSNPFMIAGLDEPQSCTSVRTSNNLHGPKWHPSGSQSRQSYAHHRLRHCTCFHVLNQLEPCLNYLSIFLQYSLPIPHSIECCFELFGTHHEPSPDPSPILAYELSTMHTQYFHCYICHLTQPGHKSLQIKIEDISHDRLLFSRGVFMGVGQCFASRFKMKFLGCIQRGYGVSMASKAAAVAWWLRNWPAL